MNNHSLWIGLIGVGVVHVAALIFFILHPIDPAKWLFRDGQTVIPAYKCEHCGHCAHALHAPQLHPEKAEAEMTHICPGCRKETRMPDNIQFIPEQHESSRPLFDTEEEYTAFRDEFAEEMSPQLQQWIDVCRPQWIRPSLI